MTMRRASCSCGSLSAEAQGEPVRNSVCHCLACKRRTGSAFAWNATYPEAAVTIAGGHSSYLRTSAEGFWARHHFCPSCGDSAFYAIERRPGLISIPVGAFADPDFPAPEVEVYDERRCGWIGQLAARRE